MSSLPSFATDEQLKIFHSIDRRLYTILTIILWRDPSESMHAIALLIWLEKVGFRNLVHKTLFLSHTNINQLMDELVACLNCVNTLFVSSSSMATSIDDIPLLRSVVMEEISLGFFVENRTAANEGATKVMNEMCIRVLSDIMPISFGTIRSSNGLTAGNNNVSINTNNNQQQVTSISFQQPFVTFGGFGQMIFNPNQMVQASWSNDSALPDQRDIANRH